MVDEEKRTNEALDASKKYNTVVEEANDYIEHFDILETITNVGNDEVFTPRKTCDMMLDSLPEEVWHNPLYKWLNPATKNGIFEREIALRLDKGLENVITNKEERRKHILQNMIFSIGQTKFTSNVARRTLYYCSQANRKCDGLKASDGHYVNGYSIGNGSWFDDEEGNVKTPCTDHKIDPRTKKCEFCSISYDSKYLDKNQREKYAYEFIHVNKGLSLSVHLSKRFFGGNRNMKFDIIIGNPPYQLSDGGSGPSASPIYNKFVEQAISLNPKYISMIIPSRWFAGGKGLDDFRDLMLKDRRIKSLTDYVNSADCFPNVDIAGGVCYFLWDRDYSGDCLVTTVRGKNKTVSKRPLNQFDIFIRSNESLSIIDKIEKSGVKTMEDVVLARNPFGFESKARGQDNEDKEHFIKLIHSQGYGYVSMSEVLKNKDLVDTWKISIGKLVPSNGEVGIDPSKGYMAMTQPRILKPYEVITDSYLVLGCFKTENEAVNFAQYMRQKFTRFLMHETYSSMNISKSNFRFVPFLDFTFKHLDQDLYKQFGFSKEEIDFIEQMIRPMSENGKDE